MDPPKTFRKKNLDPHYTCVLLGGYMASTQNKTSDTESLLLEMPGDLKKKVKQRARSLDLTMAQYLRALIRRDTTPKQAA